MKKFLKKLSSIALILLLVFSLGACENLTTSTKPQSSSTSSSQTTRSTESTSHTTKSNADGSRDFASEVVLDKSGATSLVQEVTVKSYVDGDTTHFYVPTSVSPNGVLKARYLGINTPESTGKIEEWGKAASKFTKSKLESADSIYIESDDLNWNLDSTGGRYLVWVWYRPAGESDYRCLNIEILQEGLAIASNSAQNKYGTYCIGAINQATDKKLRIYSGEKDPDFYYGKAAQVNLQDLRCHITDYVGKTVAVTGNVVRLYNNGAYIEDYYDDVECYCGMYIYYGFSIASGLSNILNIGNRVTIVGSVQLYETAGTYQIAGLIYDEYNPGDDNCELVDKNTSLYKAFYTETTIAELNSTETIVFEREVIDEVTEEETIDYETVNIKYAELLMNTSVSLKNLTVTSVYTTLTDPDSDSYGAMTLTCRDQNGNTIKVRTVKKFYNSEDDIKDKTIDIKGFVDYFDGEYQIRVFSDKQITIK